MSAEDDPDLRREGSETLDGSAIRVEIGFGTKEVNGAGIVSIAGEEQAGAAIEKTDGVGRVAGRGDDLDRAATQVDAIAIVFVGCDLPGTSGVALPVKIFGQVAADLARCDFGLCSVARTAGVGA